MLKVRRIFLKTDEVLLVHHESRRNLEAVCLQVFPSPLNTQDQETITVIIDSYPDTKLVIDGNLTRDRAIPSRYVDTVEEPLVPVMDVTCYG